MSYVIGRRLTQLRGRFLPQVLIALHGYGFMPLMASRNYSRLPHNHYSHKFGEHSHDHPHNQPKKGPHSVYAARVARKELREDPHQWNTIKQLQQLHDRIMATPEPPIVAVDYSDQDPKKPHLVGLEQLDEEVDNIFKSFTNLFSGGRKKRHVVTHSPVYGPKGLYLHGDVGSGKTMTMDLFFNTLEIDRKRRVHFHAFMLDVHRRVHLLKKDRHVTFDPIPLIAQELANEAWVLCFDELQVNDITDAMLLRRLFYELFIRGVVMVTTSNRPPDELYKNGIQRSSFLPTIALLKERCIVHSLDSGTDYRKTGKADRRVFFHPLNEETNESIQRIWEHLTNGKKVEPKTLHFLGRQHVIPEACERLGKTSFQRLCGSAHSAADYLEIAHAFDVLFVTDVPRMTLTQRNEARRFITFIDALYDNKVKLIMSSEVEASQLLIGDPEKVDTAALSSADRLLMDDLKLNTKHLESSIFTGAEESFAFQRAVSRLIEMQSEGWVGSTLF